MTIPERIAVSRDRHDEIADLLRRRLKELRDRDTPGSSPIRPAPDPRNLPTGVETADPNELRERWLAEQTGANLMKMLGGHPVGTAQDLIEVTRIVTGSTRLPSGMPVHQDLQKALWLVPGVREATMNRLAESGIDDLADLARHPRFGRLARRVVRLIEQGDRAMLMDHIGNRGGRGNLLSLALASSFDSGDLLFLDIETMGLFGGSPIIEVGLAWIRGTDIEIRQLVAATPEAEAALVGETGNAISGHPALVTFNGRSFDFPYLCQRAAYYGSPIAADPVHFDLLPYSRRVFKGRTTNCRLGTLAREILGMHRDEDVPGALVPRFYQDYLADPDHRYGLLAGIVRHNHDDMIEMVKLFEWLLRESEGGM